MKKIWKEIKNRVPFVGISIASILIFCLIYFVDDSHDLGFSLWASSTVFVLLGAVKYFESVGDEKNKKWLDERYADDPDWAKYKELKKKFNGA